MDNANTIKGLHMGVFTVGELRKKLTQYGDDTQLYIIDPLVGMSVEWGGDAEFSIIDVIDYENIPNHVYLVLDPTGRTDPIEVGPPPALS